MAETRALETGLSPSTVANPKKVIWREETIMRVESEFFKKRVRPAVTNPVAVAAVTIPDEIL